MNVLVGLGVGSQGSVRGESCLDAGLDTGLDKPLYVGLRECS